MENVLKNNERPKGLGIRHLQTLLMFLGMLFAFTMRANMSMAIVAMTDKAEPVHFDWDLKIRSTILSSFFWGYVILQIPGGELSKWFGGKLLLTSSVAINSAISLFLPFGAQFGWEVVCACRFLQGLTQAFVYPSIHHMISQWIPFEEKGLLCTLIYAGGQLGIALQLIVAGFLADALGWQSIFYTNSILGAIWTAVYLIYGSGSPEQCPRTSQDEVIYIQKSLGRKGETKKLPTPWRKIISCVPFWAVIVAHCGQNWGFFTLMTLMPTYMAQILHVELKSNGMLSSLPYLTMFALGFPMGAMVDLILKKNWLSVANSRKLGNTIGTWGPALAMIGLSYTQAGNTMFAVIMLTVAVGINVGIYTGYMLVHTDLAPNYGGSLMGITNFFANIVSIIAPLVCGLIIQDSSDPAEWRKVFFTAAAVYFFSNLFFLIFSTSERQDWNEPPREHGTDTEKTTEKPENYVIYNLHTVKSDNEVSA